MAKMHEKDKAQPFSLRLHRTERAALVDLAKQWEMRGPSQFAHFVLAAIASGDRERMAGMVAKISGFQPEFPFATFAEAPPVADRRAILRMARKGGRKRGRRT